MDCLFLQVISMFAGNTVKCWIKSKELKMCKMVFKQVEAEPLKIWRPLICGGLEFCCVCHSCDWQNLEEIPTVQDHPVHECYDLCRTQSLAFLSVESGLSSLQALAMKCLKRNLFGPFTKMLHLLVLTWLKTKLLSVLPLRLVRLPRF